jgi:VanZ family protein
LGEFSLLHTGSRFQGGFNGGAIEIVQLYVPGRSSEWFDLLADAIGISLGGLIASALVRQR